MKRGPWSIEGELEKGMREIRENQQGQTTKTSELNARRTKWTERVEVRGAAPFLERALGRLSSASFSCALSFWKSTDTPITTRSPSAATLSELPTRQMSGKWEKGEKSMWFSLHALPNIKTSSWVGRLAACLQTAYSSTWPQSSRETGKTHKSSPP